MSKAGVTSPEIRRRNRGYALKLKQRRRDEGVCLGCGGEGPYVRERDRLCLPCWFQHMARLRTGAGSDGPGLQQLYESQGGRCAYTGEQLKPGKTASLDHKQPTSRGGTNDLSNLQWVTTRVNSMKSDLTDCEFRDLCRLIAGGTERSDVNGRQNPLSEKPEQSACHVSDDQVELTPSARVQLWLLDCVPHWFRHRWPLRRLYWEQVELDAAREQAGELMKVLTQTTEEDR